MSLLVVGISHNSAPIALLERVALDAAAVDKLLTDVTACSHVTEAAVIATCNRVELYADVDRFHGSVEALTGLLVEQSGGSVGDLLSHLFVHYEDAAVAHLFQVATGLDSMAVGEGQILGQVRQALRHGQETGAVGPALNVLFQQALRVGKRARAETGVDRVAPTLVSAALDRADATGPLSAEDPARGRRAVVVGAGAMAGLAVATLVRRGADAVAVVNRSPQRAERLAAEYAPQVPGGVRAVALAVLPTELVDADLVITCAGATGVLVTRDMVATALADPARGARPGGSGRAMVLLDLALPHDVEPGVAALPEVTLVGLAELAEALDGDPVGQELQQVRRIVAEEVDSFLTARRQASVTPTVVALRSMATAVVEAEMARLEERLPGLDDAARAEIRQAVRRVSDKLLHQPTVRVRELAAGEGAVSYERALAELFALDPDAVTAVTRPGGAPS